MARHRLTGESGLMYKESDLVRIAKRENNKKRSYLVINQKQGKHIPVSPGEAFAMFHDLADLLREPYRDERLLVIGFAETATAIGASVAVDLHAAYMQTTREEIPGAGYLYFSESHSHAVEQRLVRDDLFAAMNGTDRIIFVEDEVTTGNTILSAIESIETCLGYRVKFSVASLLNGMDVAAEKEYENRGISLHYLVKTDHKAYQSQAEKYRGNGLYKEPQVQPFLRPMRTLAPSGYLDTRRLQHAEQYLAACEEMSRQVLSGIAADTGKRYLVLGTEEFMFPGLFLANRLEEAGCIVRFHATTRSPIAVSREPDYPLHVRYELCSMYEKGRRTFLYDLAPYDEIIVVCDAPEATEEGINSLLHALWESGNRHITSVRWHG